MTFVVGNKLKDDLHTASNALSLDPVKLTTPTLCVNFCGMSSFCGHRLLAL